MYPLREYTSGAAQHVLFSSFESCLCVRVNPNTSRLLLRRFVRSCCSSYGTVFSIIELSCQSRAVRFSLVCLISFVLRFLIFMGRFSFVLALRRPSSLSFSPSFWVPRRFRTVFRTVLFHSRIRIRASSHPVPLAVCSSRYDVPPVPHF